MVSEWVVVFWSFQCKVQLHSHRLVSLFKHFASQEVHSVRLVLSHSVFVSSCLFANLGNFVSLCLCRAMADWVAQAQSARERIHVQFNFVNERGWCMS